MSKKKVAKAEQKKIDEIIGDKTCNDCKERPQFEITQLDFSSKEKLCNRHFYLFSKKFTKWFLEDVLTLN